MDKLIIKIRKISEKLDFEKNMPKYATQGSAGMDIHACINENIIISPGEIQMISTGLAIQISDKNVGGFIFPRSGLSSKYGISMINCVGVIDSDYTGEIICPLVNHSKEAYEIKNGDRIAQIVFLPILQAEFSISEEFYDTTRGQQGFGSTGK